MKHLIETADLSSLPIVEYDRIVLDSTTNEIAYRGGVKYELVPDSYIYNETDNKYYQKLVAYGKPIETNATVDLNNEWISDSEDDEYTYFKSDSNVGKYGSYSQCKVTWSNLSSTSVTFKYMSSSNTSIDYLCVGKLDGEKFTSLPEDGNDNVYLSTKDKESGTYYEFTIECDEGEHHIWFCYMKYFIVGNEGEDRGFIGVPKSVRTVLDVKQGSELPTEYKFGGVSAEGGKTYDINFNNVTLPNGNIVTFYEDVEKTEKAINTEYVDLGLKSGTLWAKCNIGASSETDYGVYFQWGDISGISESILRKYSYKIYYWADYKYCNGSTTTLTKYNNDSRHGTVDNITTLETVDDAATQIMGSEWRMPTKDEIQELIDNTDNEWVEDYNGSGVNGRKFTSKTDGRKYIFIPAAGFDLGEDVGSKCYVWCSSLGTSNPIGAWVLDSNSNSCFMRTLARYCGLSVRGVRK